MAEEAVSDFRDVLSRFRSFFKSLTLAKKVVLFSAVAVVLVGMASSMYVASRDSWTPLFSGISNEDAARIKAKLDENQIPVLVGPGGGSIFVPTGWVDKARLTLAQERVSTCLSGRGPAGRQIFSSRSRAESPWRASRGAWSTS